MTDRYKEHIAFWLSEQETAYIDALVRTGAYGSDRDEVMRCFLLTGVRRAIKHGFIETFTKEQEPAAEPAPPPRAPARAAGAEPPSRRPTPQRPNPDDEIPF